MEGIIPIILKYCIKSYEKFFSPDQPSTKKLIKLLETTILLLSL